MITDDERARIVDDLHDFLFKPPAPGVEPRAQDIAKIITFWRQNESVMHEITSNWTAFKILFRAITGVAALVGAAAGIWAFWKTGGTKP